MECEFRVAGSDEQQLRDLRDWLAREPVLHRTVASLEKPAVQGQLGATLLDALQVSLAAGGTLTVLAASLAVWFRQPRRSSIRLEVTVSPGKTRLVLDAKNVKDAEALIRQAAGLTRTPPTGDDTDDSGQ